MRRMPVAGVVVAVVIGLGALMPRVAAFTTIGHSWGTSTVPYYVNPQNLYMTENDALAAIAVGASTWTGIANIQLVYAGTTSGSSLSMDRVNEVFFRNDSSGYIAETYWWYDGSGHLIDADIVFHENFKFYSQTGGCNGDGYFVANTAAHEFGHALGLGHSSIDTASMWANSYACETVRETPDPDDIAGLGSLYPGSTNTTAPPNAPSNLIAGASAASPTSSIALSWSDNASNESGYRIERSGDGANYAQIAQLSSGATSYADSGLSSGSTFYYRVYAYNSGGSSAYSNVASAQTSAAPAPTTGAPSAPTSPTPGNGAWNVSTNPTLAWTATYAVSYDVYVNGAKLAADLTATSLKIGPLTNNTTYSWFVVAKNAYGSTSGPTWTFTTKKGGRK